MDVCFFPQCGGEALDVDSDCASMYSEVHSDVEGISAEIVADACNVYGEPEDEDPMDLHAATAPPDPETIGHEIAMEEVALRDLDALAPADDASSPPPPPPVVPEEIPSLDELVAEAVISAAGFVSHIREPFCSMPSIGRITQYPSHLPPDKQSVSIRCAMHSRCSVTRMRKSWTDAQLLAWLLSGKCEPEASAARKRELGEAHLAVQDDFVPRKRR